MPQYHTCVETVRKKSLKIRWSYIYNLNRTPVNLHIMFHTETSLCGIVGTSVTVTSFVLRPMLTAGSTLLGIFNTSAKASLLPCSNICLVITVALLLYFLLLFAG